jgi:hypothetical protein
MKQLTFSINELANYYNSAKTEERKAKTKKLLLEKEASQARVKKINEVIQNYYLPLIKEAVKGGKLFFEIPVANFTNYCEYGSIDDWRPIGAYNGDENKFKIDLDRLEPVEKLKMLELIFKEAGHVLKKLGFGIKKRTVNIQRGYSHEQHKTRYYYIEISGWGRPAWLRGLSTLFGRKQICFT